jgi:mitochondrial fission protein ELM1
LPRKPPGPPLTAWAVSDGRAGIEAQVVGLAEAVARKHQADIIVKRLNWRGRLGRLPWWLTPSPRRLLSPESGIAPPWPDLWIAAGRATLPLSIGVRRWSKGATFTVQIQDPRAPPDLFDLVIPPRHDRLKGGNIFEITGSPHRVTAARLKGEYKRFARVIEALPRPRVAALIGGRSKAFDLTPERAAAIATDIQHAVEDAGGSLLMTFSRRTPPAARALLAARLRHLPGTIWDGEGENPYFAFLAAADHLLVTEDSTNMAAEAASTGKPVSILKVDGESLKFRLFHEELAAHGAARPFEGVFQTWDYVPLKETDRAAREILDRMKARGA